eukprot:6931280-Lingulodinium_polyedra.AAC.1
MPVKVSGSCPGTTYMANAVCNGFVWNMWCVCVFGVVLVRGAQRFDETCMCDKYCPGQHL